MSTHLRGPRGAFPASIRARVVCAVKMSEKRDMQTAEDSPIRSVLPRHLQELARHHLLDIRQAFPLRNQVDHVHLPAVSVDIFPAMVRTNTEAVTAAVEPETHDVPDLQCAGSGPSRGKPIRETHRLSDSRIVPVQVGLLFHVETEIVLLRELVPCPGAFSSECAFPVVGLSQAQLGHARSALRPELTGIRSPFGPCRAGRQMYQSRFGLSFEERDSLNHSCCAVHQQRLIMTLTKAQAGTDLV